MDFVSLALDMGLKEVVPRGEVYCMLLDPEDRVLQRENEQSHFRCHWGVVVVGWWVGQC